MPHTINSGTLSFYLPRSRQPLSLLDTRASRIPLAHLRNLPARFTPRVRRQPRRLRFPQSGTVEPKRRPTTVSRSYSLYFVSIDCLFPSEVYWCLPSRPPFVTINRPNRPAIETVRPRVAPWLLPNRWPACPSTPLWRWYELLVVACPLGRHSRAIEWIYAQVSNRVCPCIVILTVQKVVKLHLFAESRSLRPVGCGFRVQLRDVSEGQTRPHVRPV